MSFSLSGLFGTVAKGEQWVVSEIAKGWATGSADIKGLFDYIAAHQTSIDSAVQTMLGDVNVIAALAGHPEVSAAATAIAVSAQAITDLAANVDKGQAALPDVVAALHTVKDAQTATNALIKAATSKPATAS